MDRSRRARLGIRMIQALATLVLATLQLSSAWGLPAGRIWTPMDTTKVPGHTRLYPSRLDLDASGSPLVFATGVGGIGYNEHVLRWREADWEIVQRLGYHTWIQTPVVSTTPDIELMWQTLDLLSIPGLPYLAGYLVSATFRDDRYADVDTIWPVVNVQAVYAGATSASRRWAIKSNGPLGLMAWHSENRGAWHTHYLPGRGGFGVAAAPLDDTSAVMAWIDVSAPIRWGILRGEEWQDHGSLPGDVFLLCQATQFRLSPSGAAWLVWSTDREFVQYAIYQNGSWSLPDSISAPKPAAGRYYSKYIRPSRDRWEHPVITWVEHDATRGFRGTVCVSVPEDGQYLRGENLPGTDDAGFAESVRDSLGDVWLVWRSSDNGMFWTHSYVRASVAKLELEHHGRRRGLAWALDEAAPGSWWTILRARKGEPFEEVGRVQAGNGLEMSWIDEDSHPEQTRYKIRRDCLDVRYRAESEEVSWPPGLARRRAEPGGPRLKQPASPLGQQAELELASRAGGVLEVALYDLQGRLIYSRTVEATDAGKLRFSLGAADSPLTSGIYFARVRDASGAWSAAVRVVVLR